MEWQMSDVRSQTSEVRDQTSDIRNWQNSAERSDL